VVWEDHFYPEIIDPDTGQVLEDGAAGELVLTSLTKEAFPVIRYRTRDRTRLLPPTSRSMRRLDRINGRTDDMLIIRGVNLYPGQIEELILKQPLLAPVYLLEVTRTGHLDALTVLVEWAAGAGADESARDLATRELARRIKSSIGISAEVRVAAPGTLERSVGKARRVVDRRPH
jgi:phenylacetate-CoA ligase